MFDISPWLAKLNGDNLSGVALRDDPRFHKLERMIEPQMGIVRDDRNNPSSQVAVAVDWGAVLVAAGELRAVGRDLRLLVLVTRALANEQGLPGLTLGLTLIDRTFELFWNDMHPELRANALPQEAALRRINALLQLQNENGGLLSDLRQRTFFTPRGVGPITGYDLERGSLDERTMLSEAASGLNNDEKAALVAAHEQLVGRVRIGCAAHADQAEGEMRTLVADGHAALKALDALDACLATRIDAPRSAAPNLRRFLERMLATLENSLANKARSGSAVARPDKVSASPVPAGNGNGAVHLVPPPADAALAAFPSRLSTREDVIRCLDLVIGFYDRTEPSSPIPHLTRRIRRMVPLDFIELMEELAPSGLKEFRLLAGMGDSKKTSQKDER